MHDPSQPAAPVAAQYCATFLKPEMLHVYRQITGLRCYRPVVFTSKREHAAQFPLADLVVLPRPRTRELRRFWQKKIRQAPVQIFHGEARRLAVELQRVHAQLLHIYFGHIGVHLLPLLEKKPLPILVSFHGADAMVDMEKPKYRSAMQTMLSQVSLLLVRSHSLGDRLADLGADRAKIRIHRTGIPLEQLPFAQREPAEDGAWKFLQACRLIPKKGLRVSLRAFAEFARAFPAATFTIAGEGPLREELIQFTHELGVAEKVHLAGFVAQPRLRELFTQSHFFLHPSELGRDGNQEGVPNSMLEAMATGLPVLATTHGGIPEAVEHGISGLLVEEGDHGALAGAMRDLADDAARYRAMSAAAAHAVAEKFESHAQVRTLESYYDEAVRNF